MKGTDKVKCEFKLTDLSKGLSIKDLQNAALRLFTTPIKFPKEGPKFMTLEEFILDREYKDER